MMALSLLLAGCKNDDVNEQTVNYSCGNLVTIIGESDDAKASDGQYMVRLDYTNSRVDVKTSPLVLGVEDVQLYALNVPMKTSNTEMNTIISFSAQTPELSSGSKGSMTALQGELPTAFYFETLKVPGIVEEYEAAPTPYISYILDGRYRVRTFSKYPYFRGTTETSYFDKTGTEVFYTNDEMCYHLVMDFTKSTADLIIYRAKFAEPAPLLQAILLRGLKVEFNRNGYTVSGEKVVPEVVGDGGTTPFDRFTFDSFTLTTTSENLCKATGSYKVAGMYSAKFEVSSRP